MSNRQARRHREQRERTASRLSDHKQQGRSKLVSPWNSIGPIEAVHWLPDVLPDMLWLASLFTSYEPDEAFLIACATLNVVEDVSAPHFSGLERRDTPVLDGRLTTFDLIPDEGRVQLIERLKAIDLYQDAFTDDFAHSLGMYPGAPGRWLIEPLLTNVSVDWERAKAFLGDIILDCANGRSDHSTFAKVLFHRQWVRADRLHFLADLEVPKLLHKYPNGLNPDERDMVHGHVRATFNMLVGSGEAYRARMEAWSRTFWRANWNLFPCRSPEVVLGESVAFGEVDQAIQEMLSRLAEVEDAFLTKARQTDPDLYNPDRNEVLTGIATRALRLTRSVIETPELWATETGSPLLRGVVEGLIVSTWLIEKADPKHYARFKDYGRGKLKLLKLHLEEHIDTLETVPDETLEYLALLESQVNDEVNEEFQDIDLGSSFSGTSAHKMASEAGLGTEYQLHFAPASAIAHGEWSTLSRYSLVRCMNPLHRWHRIPGPLHDASFDSGLALMTLGYVERLIDLYCERIDRPVRADTADGTVERENGSHVDHR